MRVPKSPSRVYAMLFLYPAACALGYNKEVQRAEPLGLAGRRQPDLKP